MICVAPCVSDVKFLHPELKKCLKRKEKKTFKHEITFFILPVISITSSKLNVINTLMIEIHQINAMFAFRLLILANLPPEKILVGFTSSHWIDEDTFLQFSAENKNFIFPK